VFNDAKGYGFLSRRVEEEDLCISLPIQAGGIKSYRRVDVEFEVTKGTKGWASGEWRPL